MTHASSPKPAELIRASAGTGKTQALSDRYLGLLLAGESPDRILATTFTRKAAFEIQERVFKRLARAALEHNEFEEYQPAHLLTALRRLVTQQHRLAICTLDSFFITIASSFALELGLPSSWSVAGAHEHAQLRTSATEAWIAAKGEADLRELLGYLNQGRTSRRIQELVEGEVQALHSIYREAPRSAWDSPDAPKGLSEEQLTELLARLSALPAPTNKSSGTPNQNWVKALARVSGKAQRREWNDIAGDTLIAAYQNEVPFSKVPVGEPYASAFKPLVEHTSSDLLTKLRLRNMAIRGLLRDFDGHYDEECRARGKVSFDDIKIKLSAAAEQMALAELFFRIDTTIAHLLLDEFQDTALPQWKVLEPVATEILSKVSPQNTFFCVGDTKQAIYGWRGGVAEIFNTLEQSYPVIPPATTLSKSWRSSKIVLDTVNAVFRSLSQNQALAEYEPAARDWAARFEDHTANDSSMPGFVALERLDARSPDEKPCDAVIRRAIELIQAFAGHPNEPTIGVLVRRNQTASHIMFELSRRGIRASDEGGARVTDSPAVCALMSLLQLIDHPSDSCARFLVAHTPLGALLNFTDFSSEAAACGLAAHLRARIQRSGFGTIINQIIRQLLPHAMPRDQERLRKVGELAWDFSSLRLTEFNDRLELERIESAASENVRIMTMHAAKGLEFDIVILPELDGDIVSTRKQTLLTYRPSPADPPSRISRSAPQHIIRLSPLLQDMQRQQSMATMKEGLSLLYVALTRARRGLFMLTEEADVTASQAGILTAALSGAAVAPSVPTNEQLLITFQQGDLSAALAYRKPGTVQETQNRELPSAKLTIASRIRRNLTRIAPSSEEGDGTVTLAHLVQDTGAHARLRGSFIHRCLSEISWLEDGIISEDRLTELAQLFPEGDCSAFIPEIRDILQREAIRNLFSRTCYRESEVHCANELPFAFRHGDSLLNGTFDRLVRLRRNGKDIAAHVIDWKTDHFDFSDPAALEKKTAYYRPQLNAYRLAVQQLTGLPEDAISLSLAFVSGGVVAKIK